MKTYDFLKKTDQFDAWIRALNPVTQAIVTARTERVRETGYLGDHHGIQGRSKGGDKSTQWRNIKLALAIVDEAKAKAEREIDEELSKREEAQKHGKYGKNP